MKDIIPDSVLDILRGHYALGIANAEAFYDQNSADEDSITGALVKHLHAQSLFASSKVLMSIILMSHIEKSEAGAVVLLNVFTV